MTSLPHPNPQVVFEMQYEAVRRDEVVGVLLALFLGCFGLHHFYLGRTGLGILYCCFCWTGIPAVLGLIECFFMPGRVRRYNAAQAAVLAAALGIPLPSYLSFPGWIPPGYGYAPPASASPEPNAGEATLVACRNCRQTNAPAARFCSACGTSLG